MKRIFPWIVVVALAALVIALAAKNRELRDINDQLSSRVEFLSSGPGVGAKPPGIQVAALRGGQVSLGGQQPTPTVLYFYSTRCHYCRASIPELKRLDASMANGQAMMVGIGLPPYEEVQSYADTNGLHFPMVSDSDTRIARAYVISSTPTLVVLNRSGEVAYKHVGELTAQTTTEVVNSLGLGAITQGE
ncbi:MAG TPA: TlpA disulfide reductase family protein [Stenotrophomonas sp.]|nr:TlpA disulfide reductase family protein [Stenotrophomonas sp.]